MAPPPALPIHFTEKRFVEANSEVPENPPDDTSNFSFRDQQAAQPEASASLVTEDTPQVKGEEETVKIADSAEQTPPPPTSFLSVRTANSAYLKTTLPPQQAISAKNDLKEGKSEEGIHFEKSEDQESTAKTVLLAQNANPSPVNRQRLGVDSAQTATQAQTLA